MSAVSVECGPVKKTCQLSLLRSISRHPGYKPEEDDVHSNQVPISSDDSLRKSRGCFSSKSLVQIVIMGKTTNLVMPVNIKPKSHFHIPERSNHAGIGFLFRFCIVTILMTDFITIAAECA